MNIKTVTILITFIVMIGMTGFASAGSTTQTYIGDGSYTTSWNGNSGTMNIDTYTSNGQDHLIVDYQNGYSNGNQAGNTNTWTKITRNVGTHGYKTSVSAETYDNSGNVVAINARARLGGTHLRQLAVMNDDVNYNAVGSLHMVKAGGQNYGVSVYTQAGNAYTVIDLNGRGIAGIRGAAGAATGLNAAYTGQMVSAFAHGPGEVIIEGVGDNVGDRFRVRNDATGYTSYANGETFINLYDNHNYQYGARGYIYAVDLNTPVP